MVAWVALLSMIATVMATDMTYCAGINTAATSGSKFTPTTFFNLACDTNVARVKIIVFTSLTVYATISARALTLLPSSKTQNAGALITSPTSLPK